jgi:hypothetical protein
MSGRAGSHQPAVYFSRVASGFVANRRFCANIFELGAHVVRLKSEGEVWVALD